MTTPLGRSYAYCECLARREAGNFYHAFRILPAAQRKAMCALYAFMRIADDIADGTGPTDTKSARLEQWRRQFEEALAGRSQHQIYPALIHTLERFAIPRQYLDAALDGVGQDLSVVRFETFEELYAYCYKVASVVGLACIHIWGFNDPQAKACAEASGVAFQLTNILRDLREDAQRNRIYLPQADLNRFGYSEIELQRGERNDCFCRLMQFEVGRAREYYEASQLLPQFLPASGRAVFQVMSRTYRGLLDLIESRNYDVFSGRVRLSRWRKLRFALQALPVRWGLI